jgi:hypothetical protein
MGDANPASLFETKYTVLKFNSGKKSNKSAGNYKKNKSNLANSSSNKSYQKIDTLFKNPAKYGINPEELVREGLRNPVAKPKRLLDLQLEEDILGKGIFSPSTSAHGYQEGVERMEFESPLFSTQSEQANHGALLTSTNTSLSIDNRPNSPFKKDRQMLEVTVSSNKENPLIDNAYSKYNCHINFNLAHQPHSILRETEFRLPAP